MISWFTPHMISNTLTLNVRTASPDDRQKLANLIHFEIYVHRHLDWRPPLDWLGQSPYLVAEHNGNIVAALACPPDPVTVAWIRLFAVSSLVPTEIAWPALWSEALKLLSADQRLVWVAAIPLQHWFQLQLENSHFITTHSVVMLNWERQRLPSDRVVTNLHIRPMRQDDMPTVQEIDIASFVPVWQNSKASMEIAFQQAAIATVAEKDDRLVGYQISTSTPMGGHLARLAVLPEYQGQGIGYVLVRDMLSQFVRRGAISISVNTQQDNPVSLKLYKKMGFRPTGEEYPVYQYPLN
jgi:ribosomal-protein-alanine N-acetyltransferase